jgi:hypothetical protein
MRRKAERNRVSSTSALDMKAPQGVTKGGMTVRGGATPQPTGIMSSNVDRAQAEPIAAA